MVVEIVQIDPVATIQRTNFIRQVIPTSQDNSIVLSMRPIHRHNPLLVKPLNRLPNHLQTILRKRLDIRRPRRQPTTPNRPRRQQRLRNLRLRHALGTHQLRRGLLRRRRQRRALVRDHVQTAQGIAQRALVGSVVFRVVAEPRLVGVGVAEVCSAGPAGLVHAVDGDEVAAEAAGDPGLGADVVVERADAVFDGGDDLEGAAAVADDGDFFVGEVVAVVPGGGVD
jgi:hypothetical protein